MSTTSTKVDYNYYNADFGGELISSEVQFNRYLKKAILFLNVNANGQYDPTMTEIKDCLCALCDRLLEEAISPSDISEKVGNWSKSAGTTNKLQQDLGDIFYGYLGNLSISSIWACQPMLDSNNII